MSIHSDITYEDKVGMALQNLKIGDSLSIATNVRPDNRERFTAVVKSYIDRQMGHTEGWFIEFSNDNNFIRKRSLN